MLFDYMRNYDGWQMYREDICISQRKRRDNVCYKYTLTAICISVMLTCESMHVMTVCFTATLYTYMAIKSAHLHFELWSNPALCTEPLCNAVFCLCARKQSVQATSDTF